MTGLPGCCFVEESCEALLSRMVGRCRANARLVDFEDILRLYVTLPPPSREPRGTTGTVRQPLVYLFARRLRRVLEDPASQPYAEPAGARDAHWRPSFPDTLSLPAAPGVTDGLAGRLEVVLQGALVSLSTGGPVTQAVRDFAQAEFPAVATEQMVAGRQGAADRIRQWAGARRRRGQAQRRQAAEGTASQPDQADESVAEDAPALDVRAGADEPPLVDVDEAWSPAGSPELASDGASLYSPAEEADRFSAGWHSYGDTDSLGSVGEHVVGREAEWTTLEQEGWDLDDHAVPPDGVRRPPTCAIVATTVALGWVLVALSAFRGEKGGKSEQTQGQQASLLSPKTPHKISLSFPLQPERHGGAAAPAATAGPAAR
jgi:hypothetical protein